MKTAQRNNGGLPRGARPVCTFALVCPAVGAVKISAGVAIAACLPVAQGLTLQVGRVLPGNQARALHRRFAHLHIQHGWFWLTAELEQWLGQ